MGGEEQGAKSLKRAVGSKNRSKRLLALRLRKLLCCRFLAAKLGVDELVELAAVQHGLNLGGFDVGAVVFYAAIIQDVGADLVAPSDRSLFAVELFQLVVALGLLHHFQPAFEEGHGEAFVLLIRSFDRANDLNSGGDVGDSDRGGDFVDVLPTGPGG